MSAKTALHSINVKGNQNRYRYTTAILDGHPPTFSLEDVETEVENLVTDVPRSQCLGRPESDSDIRHEIYLQLIKQTRDNPDTRRSINLWHLFEKIATTIPCPKVLVEIVGMYAKEVSEDIGKIPVIRQSSWKIRNSIWPSLGGDRVWWIAPGISSCVVRLSTGQVVTSYYDKTSLISDLIYHIALSIGLETPKHFQIYRSYKGREEMLDRKGTVAFAVASRPGHLVMRKEMFRLKDEETCNRDLVFRRLAFTQCRDQHLKQNCPIDESKAIELCALMIVAEFNLDYFQSEDFASKISDFLPEGLEIEEAVDKVKQAGRLIGQISSEEAQIKFLSGVDDLPYGNCIFFEVAQISTTPYISLIDTAFLGINRLGVHFFSKQPGRILYSAEILQISFLKFQRPFLVLDVNCNGTKDRFKIQIQDGDLVIRCIRAHQRDLESSITSRNNSSDAAPSRSHGQISSGADLTLSVIQESDKESLPGSSKSNELPVVHARITRGQGKPPRSQSRHSDNPTLIEKLSRRNSFAQDKSTSIKTLDSGRSRFRKRIERMNQLKIGEIIADKYRIEGCEWRGKEDVFCACGLVVDEKYLVKFFRDVGSFDQAKNMYEKLRGSCRVPLPIEVRSARESAPLPPFVVTERAQLSLNKWMRRREAYKLDRKAVLRQVLSAVRDIHELGLRLIQLDADAFGVFKSEGGWKVVDVDNLIKEGQSVDISSAYSREFSPPEWFQAEEEGAEKFTPTKESNMWSLGILAIQILTGKGLYGLSASKKSVKECLAIEELPELDTMNNELERCLIRKLLRIKAEERITVDAALRDPLFDISGASQA